MLQEHDLIGREMVGNDQLMKLLDIKLVEILPGSATTSMKVRVDMLNSWSICHGGVVTTLADSAFALASNSHNIACVTASISLDFLAKSKLGDTLSAQATEVCLAGRTGIYDVVVTNQHGSKIAVARLRSRTINGQKILNVSAN